MSERSDKTVVPKKPTALNPPPTYPGNVFLQILEDFKHNISLVCIEEMLSAGCTSGTVVVLSPSSLLRCTDVARSSTYDVWCPDIMLRELERYMIADMKGFGIMIIGPTQRAVVVYRRKLEQKADVILLANLSAETTVHEIIRCYGASGEVADSGEFRLIVDTFESLQETFASLKPK